MRTYVRTVLEFFYPTGSGAYVLNSVALSFYFRLIPTKSVDIGNSLMTSMLETVTFSHFNKVLSVGVPFVKSSQGRIAAGPVSPVSTAPLFQSPMACLASPNRGNARQTPMARGDMLQLPVLPTEPSAKGVA